jgi:hypothetical protein
MIFQNFGFNRQIVKAAAAPAFSYPAGAFAIYDFGNSASYPGSGGTVYDVSGNSNNGTFVNSPTWSSANGGILQMVRSSYQYITYDATFTPTITTIFIWKNTDATNQSYWGFPSARYSYGTINTLDINSAPYNKQLAIIPANKDGNFSTFGGAYVGPSDIQIFNQYSTIIKSISSSSTTVTNYINNLSPTANENKNFDRTGTSGSGTGYLGIDPPQGTGQAANGYLMGYLHYNKELTTSEITDIYNTFSTRF